MAIRISTLAEVQVLSLATLAKFGGKNLGASIEALRGVFPQGNAETVKMSDLFKTVGLATTIRINEQWGTQPIFGIGAPTRPAMVPNNYQVSIGIEKLQLDRKDNWSYITSPDYWYSKKVQNGIGLDDFLLYSYIVIRDKERPGIQNADIYAAMPSSSTSAVQAGESTIVHNADMVGFKVTYRDILGFLSGGTGGEAIDTTLLTLNRTTKIGNGKDTIFGAINGNSTSDNSYTETTGGK